MLCCLEFALKHFNKEKEKIKRKLQSLFYVDDGYREVHYIPLSLCSCIYLKAPPTETETAPNDHISHLVSEGAVHLPKKLFAFL